ncbi:aldehyde dehydrogenase [Emcibacter nanhaiensis]|uniref:Aldehyde dehydrogenase n=1 Tax=Emcibacter nanhaiensis TaxID=1505037 RepID=A0A501PI33_9PROT|nr:aldehyde dehydrogenase [Emcibacter nanhaiensis]TPD59855.1 aldehyde dehydrogenase [Emcibacter nanhaiensis]
MATVLPENVNIKHPDKLFIGGEWVAPTSGDSIEVVSPHTEEVCAVIAEANADDVNAAVAAARQAFDHGPWPTMSVSERANALRRMAEILRGRIPELAAAFTAEIGALSSFAPVAVGGAVETLAAYADIGENYAWETSRPSTVPGNTAHVIREPVGVVAAIAPWNMPGAIMTQKIAPALISGCPVIMKPSPETPLEAYIIAEAAEEAGLPAGVINLVTAHREAADQLVQNPGVDKISFTGSTAAGRHIASVAGARMARVTLELGGKSPAIVLDDMPAEVAGKILARTITILSGQVCAMLSRAIVPAHRHDEIAEAIIAEMKQVKVGSPLDPETEMGPVAMKRQLERIEHYVETGIKEGAILAYGGRRVEGLKGYYFEPTLFTNVDNKMTIAREEIFGPVLSLIPARDVDHAVELANETEYGLNSSVFTNDAEAAYAIGRRIRAGNMAQNGMNADFTLPFGGFKCSGIGREGGVEGLTPYIETKVMLLQTGEAAE